MNCIPICRVCLKTSLEYIDFETPFDEEIFDDEAADNKSSNATPFTYLDCFRECTNVECDFSVPQSLCDACGLELKITYDFIRKARRADRLIKEAVQKTKYEVEMCKEEEAGELHNDMEFQDNFKYDYEELQVVEESIEEEINYACAFCNDTFHSQFVLNLHVAGTHSKDDKSENYDNLFTEEVQRSIAEENNRERADSKEYENSQFTWEENMEMDQLDSEHDGEDQVEEEFYVSETTYTESNGTTTEENTKETPIGSVSSFKCASCPRSFSTPRSLMLHWKAHKPESKLNCKICHKEIEKSETMRDHVQKTHSHIVPCDKCDYKGKESKLFEHEKRVHAEHRDFPCTICSKTFTSNNILNAHLKCHQRKQSNAKSDACEICGKQFSTNHYLRLHMEVHRDERELHQCESCDKLYISKSALENHMRIHKGDTLKCPECGKHFARQYELKVHMRFHTRDYPFACEVCGKTFAIKGHLRSHMWRQVCGKTFAIKGHLRSHMWRHQGLKLQCEECGKLFTSTKALHEHSFSHTEMPFPCTYCARGYPSKQKYKVHLKTAHLIELNEYELQKISNYNTPKPLLRRKLTLVQAVDSVVREVEVKTKEDDSEEITV